MGRRPDCALLVLGADGQVGRALRLVYGGRDDVVALDRARANLEDDDQLRAAIRQYRPAAVINAAAYTAVDRAEHDAERAHRVNAAAPASIAEEVAALGGCMVHYSTDYVFDGEQPGAYRETDPPNPASVYGQTKLSGERAVIAGCPRHIILRTSWVYAARGMNFINTMLRLASERDRLRVVADQHGAPTSASLIASVTATVLEALQPLDVHRHDARSSVWGVYHLTPRGATTWWQLAQYVVAGARARGAVLRADEHSIEPISTAEYNAVAPRPKNSMLNCDKLQATFGMDLPHWTRDVDQLLDSRTPDESQ